jgi:hypothetical protein
MKNPIGKPSVKQVAGSRGIRDRNLERGSIPEAAPIPS